MALPPLSEYWRAQRKVLRQLLWGMSSEGSVGTALVQALRQPLTHHVQQYVLLLLSLSETIGEVGSRGGRCCLLGLSPVRELNEGRNRALAQGTRLSQDRGLRRTRPYLGDLILFWGI